LWQQNIFLRPAFPAIRFEYVSPGAGFQFRKEIGHAIYQQLQEMNRLDGELVFYGFPATCVAASG
jgi:hypothetical protein